MKRVLVLSTFDEETMRALERDPLFVVGQDAEEANCVNTLDTVVGVVVRSGLTIDYKVLDTIPTLRFVIRAGSGVDNIEVEELRRRNIELVRNPSLSAEAVAELAVSGILSLTRRMPEAMGLLRRGVWAKGDLIGDSLGRLSVGIWGAGPVGMACYRALRGLCAGVRFASWPSLPHEVRNLSAEPAELLSETDVHVLCLPGRPQTVGLFGEAFFNSVQRRRPYLVNVGRHELIDVAAATQALELSHLRGLFIDPVNAEDVSELAQLLDRTEGLNMIVTQHLGARRADVLATMGMWVIRTAKVLVNKLEVH